MYVTKEQVEAMIAQALANGPAAPGESTTDRQINSLADTVKAIADTAQEAFAGLSALRREVSDQSRRLGDLENSKPSLNLDMGQPAPIPEGVGTLIEHTPEAPAPSAAQPPAAEPTQG